MYTPLNWLKLQIHFLAVSVFVKKKMTPHLFAIIFSLVVILATVFVPSYALLTSRILRVPSLGTVEYIKARKLHADGRWLMDPYGNIIQLIGYAGGVQTMGGPPVGLWERNGSSQHYDWIFDEQAIIENLDAMKATGANAIRSHICMWYIKNDGAYVEPYGTVEYKQNLHRMIELAGERSIYVIIDGMMVIPSFLGGSQDALPYPPYQDGSQNQTLAQEVIPDKQAFIDLWLELALYLEDLPNVLFEPWNEPHAPLGYDTDTVRKEWFTVVRDLVAAFRANGIDHPVVVQWGYGVAINWNYPEDMPEGKMYWPDEANTTIDDPINNLIMSKHIYRQGGAFGIYSTGQARQDYEDVKQAMQLELIEESSKRYPVLIGEIGASVWGEDTKNETIALENALQILNEWKISWLVYWWRVGGKYALFDGDTYIFQPTLNLNENGFVVRNAMLGKG